MKKPRRNLENLKRGNNVNNNGRPKGSLNRKTIFNRWAEIVTKTKNPLTEQIEGLTQDDLVILSLLNKARKGDVNAIREWLDSRFGKIKDISEIELKNSDEKLKEILDEINAERFSENPKK